jgi:hypothetical protein
MIHVNSTSQFLSGNQWHFDRAHGSRLPDSGVLHVERPNINNKRRGTKEYESDTRFSPLIIFGWLLSYRQSTSQIDKVSMLLECDDLTRRQEFLRRPRYGFAKTRLSYVFVFVGSIDDGR